MTLSLEEKKERQIIANRKYNDTHKELVKERQRVSKRKWYASHKDEALKRVDGYKNMHLEQNRVRQKKYRDSHKDKLWLGAVKQRAAERNIPFDIEESDVVIPEFCPILGIPLFRSGKQATDNSPSIDRIIPMLGYTKGNVQVISKKANSMKSTATYDELIAIGKWAQAQIDKES
jgi:hypothetical protein